jgi:hypothetical protein
MGSKSVPMPLLATIRKSSKTAIRVEGLNNRQLSNASGLMLGSASKLPWADRLLVPMDTPKIKRDNEGKRRKRKNEGINRRIETLITKAYEIGKFDGVDVALTICKHGRYTTYNSKVHASWPPSMAEIVSKATICLNTRVLILYF